MEVKVGISSCLLGEKVRWDGGHRHDQVLTQTLGRFVNFLPVCPEVECGFSVPRQPLYLVGDPDRPRLVATETRDDFTQKMEKWAGRRLQELEIEGLCGFVFKSRSPSCGMEGVEVVSDRGIHLGKTGGVFARMFAEKFPTLPVEDENRLQDQENLDEFIERIKTSGAPTG